MFRKKRKKNLATSQDKSRINRLRPLAGLFATGLSVPAFMAGQSVPFPTYQTGPQSNGSYVVSSGQIITPAGMEVNLGFRVRAKAIALNPTSNHTAAVLTMGTSASNGNGVVEVFNTQTGVVMQDYIPHTPTGKTDSSGSYSGIAYSADGKHLVFSQDSSKVTVANVDANGMLTDNAQVSVPPNNSFINCFPNSPPGNGRPCGTFYTTSTSYPGGVAITPDGTSAYALLNQNNTLTKINLTANPPVQGAQIRVGNAPHSVVISDDGKTAFVSNEGGRPATQADFQIYSAGTPIVADPFVGAATTGTVSFVDLPSMKVTTTIQTDLHPTGMALYGNNLLVANTFSDTISIINIAGQRVTRTIDLGLPVGIPGQGPASGAGPNSIAMDASDGVAYVALYNANAIAVVNLNNVSTNPLVGMIPVEYAPSSVVWDKADNTLIVANDKGIGTTGAGNRNTFETDFGVTALNTHQDIGTVSIIPIPDKNSLQAMTAQVYQNNHWDLAQNINSAGGGSPTTPAVALPAKIGDPSLIKHVFLIVRENRTYDQILGDVAAGNGSPSLAVFGAAVTPNAHALVKRFPLFDNFYDPSRQSADGHQWITEGMAPYADDIQSPDWVRSYPGGNAGDALAYQKKGFLFSEAESAGLPVKIYGEYVENDSFLTPTGATTEPTWTQFYNDSQAFESAAESTLYYQNTVTSTSSIPAVSNYLVKNFPPFDLQIPDQFRVDLWAQDFNKDLANGTVPALSILWIMDDHTGSIAFNGSKLTPQAEQADNDLAIGRMAEIISKSSVWSSSAIFVEEDDAQNGVDHVDGHRSPGYIISPYTVQNATTADHTHYTQTNMTRTMEQILGLPPMNQMDLVASPMSTAFVTGTPPPANFAPFTHVAATTPLTQTIAQNAGNTKMSHAAKALQVAWLKKGDEMFAGKLNKPDAEDPDTLNHLTWYLATAFKRPYPGETKVRPPSDFTKAAPTKPDVDE